MGGEGKSLSSSIAEAFAGSTNALVESYRMSKAVKEELLEASKVRFENLKEAAAAAAAAFRRTLGIQGDFGSHRARVAVMKAQIAGMPENEVAAAGIEEERKAAKQRKELLDAEEKRLAARLLQVRSEMDYGPDAIKRGRPIKAALEKELLTVLDERVQVQNRLTELDLEEMVVARRALEDKIKLADAEKARAAEEKKRNKERIDKVDADAAADIADIRKRADEAVKDIVPRGVNVSSLAAVGGYSGGTDRSGITVAERTARATEITAEAVQEMRTRQAEADRERQDKGT
jgi:hypothetical protein